MDAVIPRRQIFGSIRDRNKTSDRKRIYFERLSDRYLGAKMIEIHKMDSEGYGQKMEDADDKY